jgi:hypothetical protein
MLESTKGLNSWHHKDCKTIYKLYKQRIMKQNESNGNLESTTIIGLGGKLLSHLKINRKQSWKWRGVCQAYIKTPYRNLMLDKWILIIKEIHARHMLFLPQKVVRHEVWIGGF